MYIYTYNSERSDVNNTLSVRWSLSNVAVVQFTVVLEVQNHGSPPVGGGASRDKQLSPLNYFPNSFDWLTFQVNITMYWWRQYFLVEEFILIFAVSYNAFIKNGIVWFLYKIHYLYYTLYNIIQHYKQVWCIPCEMYSKYT